MELEATLDVRGASDDVGKAPLADGIFRMVMRLLSETRSVLEYLSQHLPTVRSLDIDVQEIVLQFPQERNSGKNDVRFEIDGAELKPTGKCNRTCSMVINGPYPSQQQNKLQQKLRTENIATISNEMIP
jgi:hypothetical protein